MPKRINPLSPSAIANARPKATAYTLRDGFGLLLLVKPKGGKLWRFDYRRPGTGRRNTLSLGTYPDVSLKLARTRRDDARKLLADGIDPADKRKAETVAAADTFEAVAREWYATRAGSWVPAHAERIIRRLERDVFPWIGRKPMARVQAPDVLAVLRRIQARGAIETAHRALTNIGQVIRYGIATGRTQTDVTHKLGEALTPVTERHHAAVTDPDLLGHLLRDIAAYNGTLPVRCALQLAPLVFLRPGELRQAEWQEFDLDAGEWNIPAHRRKLKKALKDDPLTGAHLVPLACQAVAILRELQPLTGAGRFVFPGTRDRKKPLSDMALLAALRRMGYDKATVTTHGWRATARTILDEGLHFPMHVKEHQLDHAVRDANGRAYNRTSHLPERRKMMQAWADYLDALRAAPGKVVAIGKARKAQ